MSMFQQSFFPKGRQPKMVSQCANEYFGETTLIPNISSFVSKSLVLKK